MYNNPKSNKNDTNDLFEDPLFCDIRSSLTLGHTDTKLFKQDYWVLHTQCKQEY